MRAYIYIYIYKYIYIYIYIVIHVMHVYMKYHVSLFYALSFAFCGRIMCVMWQGEKVRDRSRDLAVTISACKHTFNTHF